MRRLKFLLVPLAGLALLMAHDARAQEPVTIRIGWVVPVVSIAPILFVKKGIAQYEGKTYKLQFIHFQGSPPQINAMAIGALDIGELGFTSLPLAIQNAHLDDLRVIVDEMRVGSKGYGDNEYRVLKDSNIHKVSDLKGKVLATNVLGSAVDIAMNIELKKHGIDPKTDVNVIEAAFPTMKSMLFSGKADLVPTVPPFSEEPDFKAKARSLFTQGDAMGGPSEQEVYVARKAFLEKHRAAVVDFLSDYLRALHFYLDPKNHDEVVKIAAEATKLPAKVFQSWVFTRKDDYRPPNGVPDTAILQHNVDMLHKYGYLNEKLDMSKYVDASLIEDAAKKLKQ